MKLKDVNKFIISTPELDMPTLKGMGSTLFYKMLENQNQMAQIDEISKKKETYGYVLQKCIRTAIRMRCESLKSGDIISICSLNHLNTYVPFLAGLFLDVQTASLDPRLPVPDTVHLLKQVSPKMIFVEPAAVELIENALEKVNTDTKIVVFGHSGKHLQFSDFLQPSSQEESFVPVEVKDIKSTAVIFFSSGTTGLPKGICLSHYSFLRSFYQNDIYIRPGEVVLAFAPIYWISAVATIIHCIMNAAARLICSKFDPEQVWDLIKDFKVNVLSLPTNLAIVMCKKGQPKGADISSLRYIRTGGGPLSEEQILELRRCLEGVIIIKAYGQTEICGDISFRFDSDAEHLRLLLEKPKASGKPMPGFTCKIVDPETEEIFGPYQEGELRVKTETQMNGYHNMDSSDCWDSDGFIKTGDIAYYDEDGCFYIVDRLKEIIRFQNWDVQPARIEGILLTHPAIENAIVIGIPHPEDRSHPMGIVVLKQHAIGSVTVEEIEKYVEEKVDDKQRLRAGVKFVKSIPVTPNGKINRRGMKELVLQGKTW